MEQEGGKVRSEVMCGGGLAQRNPGQEEARKKPFPLLTRHGVGSLLGTGYQRGPMGAQDVGRAALYGRQHTRKPEEGLMKAPR